MYVSVFFVWFSVAAVWPQKVTHINCGAVHAHVHAWCSSNSASSISNNSTVCKGKGGTPVLGSGMQGCLVRAEGGCSRV